MRALVIGGTGQAEDQLIGAWKNLCEQMPRVNFLREPGYTTTYTGPGGKPRSASWS